MPDLPPEIIAGILSRLPVKPLLRFRCVSKPWCALIDCPNFIKMHLNRTMQTRINTASIILTHSREPHLYSMDTIDSLEKPIELDHPLKTQIHDRTPRVWGSCNGLLCSSNAEDDLFLWNPSTKKHRKLPFSAIETTRLFTCICQNVVYGFGFDSVSDDYKVLRIVQFHGALFMDSEVRVYSLKSNSWKRVRDFPDYLSLGCEPGLLATGALHWMGTVNSEVDQELEAIVSFDLGTEGFQIVPKPEYKATTSCSRLGVLEGCLCMLCSYEKVGVDIWVMKEYGVKDSWTKLMSIKHSNQITCSDFLKPIAYSEDGGKVLFVHEYRRFIWYDIVTKIIEDARSHDWPYHFDADVCLGSLVPLGGGRGSDGKQQAAQDKMEKMINRKKRDDFLSKGFRLVL